MQPENITYTLGLGRSARLNDAIYRELRDDFYDRFTHIHCPSDFIAGELEKHGYKAAVHVISNGISPRFCYRKRGQDPCPAGQGGRDDDRPPVQRKAAGCAHRRRLPLPAPGQHPAGAGGAGAEKSGAGAPGRRLPNPPIFGFFPEERLRELLSMTDLYVHASDAEIEAISCIEAFASGLVPVIADSPKSATPQFALDRRSLFAAGDSVDLASRIDYWLDHPAERRGMELRYAEAGRRYHLDVCVAQAEEMFRASHRPRRARRWKKRERRSGCRCPQGGTSAANVGRPSRCGWTADMSTGCRAGRQSGRAPCCTG